MNSEGGKPGNVLTVNGNYTGNNGLNGQTVSRDGARNLGEVRTGVEAKVNNNLSLWGNVGVQLGDKGYSDTQGMLGVKYSW
nr:autotransporter outer membrane beta-barrel domain-containing protein [Escherichia coli]